MMRGPTRTFRLFAALLLAGLAGGVAARAQTTDAAQADIRAQIVRWKEQQTAADRDVALVDDTFRQFLAVAGSTVARPDQTVVQPTLELLRRAYPDFRLHYRGPQDYCRVTRAIDDARSAALARVERSLNHQLALLGLSTAMAEVSIYRTSGALLGRQLSDAEVAAAFADQVTEATRGEVATTWGGMDYLVSAPAGEIDCG